MSTRFPVRCFALLLLLGSTLGALASPALAQSPQALERARLLHTLSLLQHRGAAQPPAAKAAQSDVDSSTVPDRPQDPDVPPAAGTGSITGRVSGTCAIVKHKTDIPRPTRIEGRLVEN